MSNSNFIYSNLGIKGLILIGFLHTHMNYLNKFAAPAGLYWIIKNKYLVSLL